MVYNFLVLSLMRDVLDDMLMNLIERTRIIGGNVYDYPSYIVAVETSDLYTSQVIQLPNTLIAQGAEDYNILRHRFHLHKNLDNFNITIEEIQNNGIVPLKFKAREK